MQTVTINKDNALKAWQAADNAGKTLLENLFGKDVLTPKDVKELINTWDDVLARTGRDSSEFNPRPGETDDEVAYRQVKLIASAYNNGKIPSLSENRYYPWFKIENDNSKPSGFGLSCGVYDYRYTVSLVCVRLCFINADDAKDAGKKFTAIYERLQIF